VLIEEFAAMSRLRIQFAVLGSAYGALGGQIDDGDGLAIGGATLTVGSVATEAALQPVVPEGDAVFVRLTAIGAAIHVAAGADPNPAAEPRHLVLAGETLRILAPAGARLAAVLADNVPANLQVATALASNVAPQAVAGSLDALSLNTRGALRVVQQNPDGTDVDTTAPVQTVPARSGTVTVAQASVTNAAPTAPALAANPGRRAVRLHYPAGGPAVFWGPTVGVTAATGFRVPAAVAFDVLPGYTGDVFLIADAAGPVSVSVSQLG
jgi:hypothetical protein